MEPFEHDQGDKIDVWDLNTNQLWRIEDRVTNSSFISHKFLVYLTAESEFKVRHIRIYAIHIGE